MENKIFNLFVSVHMRFLFISHSANAPLVRRGLFNSVESFVHVHAQNLELTPLEKGALWMGFLQNTCVPCLVLVQFASIDVRWT